MQSMTGYGKGVAARDGREITVECKSVNHRFLDIGLRLPRFLACTEDVLRGEIAAALSRGHVDVFVGYANTRADARSVQVDNTLLAAYVCAAREANAAAGLPDDLTLQAVLRLPDVTSVVMAQDDEDAIRDLTKEATQAALTALIAMRAVEGEKLRADMSDRLGTLSLLLDGMKARAPFVAGEYRAKLNERIASMVDEALVDSARLATEVAVFADRAAIDEELVRIESHLEQFAALLGSQEAVGRKLDFLLQELGREFNTVGSKANDSALTQLVLNGKAELEKLREQIQNVE